MPHLLTRLARRVVLSTAASEVTRQFLEYVRNPKLMPAWEQSAMLAKYYVTTGGSRRAGGTRKTARTTR